MRRLLNKYRWELWLFIGIPAVSSVFVYFHEWSPAGRDDDLRFLGWGSLIAFVCGALLKGASYRWVCRLGRPTLAVLWRCALATSVVGAVSLSLINVLYPLRASRTSELDLSLLKWVIVIVVLAVIMSMVPALVRERRVTYQPGACLSPCSTDVRSWFLHLFDRVPPAPRMGFYRPLWVHGCGGHPDG